MAAADRQPDTQRLLSALSSPVRREILWLVWDRELPAGDIAATFELRAPTISEHLAVLREAGLVSMRRDGTFRRYRANQEMVEEIRPLLARDDATWKRASSLEPRAAARGVAAVVVEVDAPVDQVAAFRAFTDGELYTRWAGVPVRIVDGQFSATMEWGLQVRGSYDHVVPPALIVMSWDFAAGDVPIPGEAARAFLEIEPRGRGSHLTIYQLVSTDEQARYMERAWGVMLERFRVNVADALDPSVDMPLRPRQASGTR